jgi:hypothetical protein
MENPDLMTELDHKVRAACGLAPEAVKEQSEEAAAEDKDHVTKDDAD